MAHAPTRYDRHVFAHYIEEGEELLAVIHRHWIIAVLPVTESILLGVVLPIVAIVAFPHPWWLAAVFIAWLIIGFFLAHHVFHDWFCDAFLLTDRGLVRVDWKNIVSHESERIDYTSIDTVEYEKAGLFATLFSYGKLLVVTANSTHSLETIRHPQTARDTLSKARDEARDTMYGGSGDGAGKPVDVEVLHQALRRLLAQDFNLPDATSSPADARPPDPPQVNDVAPPPTP